MFRQNVAASLFCVITVALGGCAARTNGIFRADGYYHEEFPYRVAYGNRAQRLLLPPQWRLDNFRQPVPPGRPAPVKVGTEYETSRHIDTTGDGIFDDQMDALTYDLRFMHQRHDAEIWVRTLPLSQRTGHRELRVLARNYIDDVAGAGYVAVDLGGGRQGVEERRFATRLVREGPLIVGNREAYSAIFDVANVDQLQMHQESRFLRVEIILVRTGAIWQVPDPLNPTSAPRFPVIMIARYANLPEDFDRDAPTFHEFLQRIQWQGAPPSPLPEPTPRSDTTRPGAPPPVVPPEAPPPEDPSAAPPPAPSPTIQAL